MQLTAETTFDPARPALSAASRPICDDHFERLMQALDPFEREPTLAVAVSGGPDSLALTLLAARWAGRRGGRAVGLTVDHRLRATSGEEARQTGRWLGAWGVEHHILPWEGPKPATGLQRHARDARYDRLTAWCREAGVLHLLTGHHREDQEETVALREARHSGASGLAGMAAIRELAGVRLLRPLLGQDKASLMATLDHLGQDWIDDPSNQSPAFTRNRLRRDGLDRARHADEAARRGQARHTLERRLAAAFCRWVTIDPRGFAVLRQPFLGDLSDDLAEPLLSRTLMAIGGLVYPPGSASLRRLLDAMRDERPFSGRTLAFCRVLRWRHQWLVCRETASSERSALPPHQWRFWEKRFRIRSRSPRESLAVRRLGEDGWRMRNILIEQTIARTAPPAVRPSLPSIWRDEQLLAIPHLGLFERSFDASLLDLEFRPATPLANAPFAAHMGGHPNDETSVILHRRPFLGIGVSLC